MANICIYCKKEVSGGALKVRDDRIISAIRFVKQKANMAQNNQLYVCREDAAEHAKRRKHFEKESIMYGFISAAIAIVLIGIPLLGGRFDFLVFLMAIGLALMIFILGAMFKYVPAVEEGAVLSQPDDAAQAQKLQPAQAAFGAKVARSKGKPAARKK